MRLRLVSEHNPEREGTASGRLLRAVGDGLIAEGHEVTAICWTERAPREQLPDWAEWRPVARPSGLRDHVEALWRPRWASSALRLPPDPSATTVAEDPLSYAAVVGRTPNAVVVHYATLLDARALGQVRPTHLQGHRAERRAVRGASVPLAYSAQVAAALGGRARWVPAAVDIPADPLSLVDRPVALLLAGWDWPANRAALSELLGGWPEVRASVPGAELLVAGRGTPSVAAGPGVRVLGAVPATVDAFAQAAVLAFPCPPTTGPKVKVLEAMAAGLPVVTTPAGVDGLAPEVAAAAVVVEVSQFALALADVLRDPSRRADLAQRGRDAVRREHAPRVAAAARVQALSDGLS